MTHTADSMIRMVLRVAAIATFSIGVATLLAPEIILQWFGANGSGNHHFVRFIGTALIGFSVMNWLYSNFDSLQDALPAIFGNLTSLSIAVIVDIWGFVMHDLASTAWVILLVHIIFGSTFAYCALLVTRGPATEKADARNTADSKLQ